MGEAAEEVGDLGRKQYFWISPADPYDALTRDRRASYPPKGIGRSRCPPAVVPPRAPPAAEQVAMSKKRRQSKRQLAQKTIEAMSHFVDGLKPPPADPNAMKILVDVIAESNAKAKNLNLASLIDSSFVERLDRQGAFAK